MAAAEDERTTPIESLEQGDGLTPCGRHKNGRSDQENGKYRKRDESSNARNGDVESLTSWSASLAAHEQPENCTKSNRRELARRARGQQYDSSGKHSNRSPRPIRRQRLHHSPHRLRDDCYRNELQSVQDSRTHAPGKKIVAVGKGEHQKRRR